MIFRKRSVVAATLDLGSHDSIQAWSDSVIRHVQDGDPLHGLVHHAGAMGLGVYTESSDGEEMQWATNYSGPFRLTQCLWAPLLQHNARVLCLTSSSHCTPNNPLDFTALPGSSIGSPDLRYNGWTAYQQSQLASILFARQLNKEFVASGSGALSVAVAESDKWFYNPKLLLEEDKEVQE